MNTLFEVGFLFLKLHDLGGKGSVLDALIQKVEEGNEHGELGVTDFSFPLGNLLSMVCTVVIVKVFKLQS
jgi:hypothetical protein